MGAQHTALPRGRATVFVQEVHQQRGVQVQRFARAAGQRDGKVQLLPCRFIVDAGQVRLDVQRFVSALGLFGDLGVFGGVIKGKGVGGVGGPRDVIGGGFDLADLFDSRGNLGDNDAARHQRLQGGDPYGGVDGLGLGLNLTAFAQALLP